MFTNKKILITGGAGFIGSNLAEALLNAGAQVTVMDNFSTGRHENLADFKADPAFALIEGDIRDRACCQEAAAGQDMAVHLAALGSVPRSIAEPEDVTEVNVSGFVNMLSAAKNAGVQRFVYASSSAVYGDSQTAPKTEECIGTALSPYAVTKRTNELFAENFARVYGFRTIGLRFFNVFGPRQNPAGAYAAVVPKFIQALLNHEPPVINGDGSISRDFTYAGNVTAAVCAALSAENPEALDNVYNIACGGSTSLNELFEKIRETLAEFDPEIASIQPVHGPARQGDIMHSSADISKAKTLLGYSPKYDLLSGLLLTAESFRKNKF